METAIQNFILTFVSIVYEAMPFIVLGAIIAGILEEMLPSTLVATILRLLPSKRLLPIFIGGLLGLIFPMCECGIVPIMRRLLRKGLPLSCCTAYLLAGPIINVVVILSTLYAFRDNMTYSVTERSLAAAQDAGVPSAVIAKLKTPALEKKVLKHDEFQAELNKVLDSDETQRYESLVMKNCKAASPDQSAATGQFSSLGMTGLRMCLGYIIAVCTSLIVDWQYRKYGAELLTPLARPSAKDEEAAGPRKRQSAWKRLNNITETALGDFVDITAFLILGALLAATVHLCMDHATIAVLSRQHIVPAILIMMALAILLCLCSEADAFFAASFTGLPPAAKLAFLVLGPMMDLKLYMLYTRVFRPRLIVTIFGAVMVQVFIWSLVVHYIWVAYLPSS